MTVTDYFLHVQNILSVTAYTLTVVSNLWPSLQTAVTVCYYIVHSHCNVAVKWLDMTSRVLSDLVLLA